MDTSPPPTEQDRQLLKAAEQGYRLRALLLVQQGASLQARHEPDQRTVLHAAAENGHLEVVKGLIKAGADVDARTDSGKSALSLAVAQGDKDTAAVLLAAGADVDSADKKSRTPLHKAASREDLPMMRLLLNAGARVRGTSNTRTPLHLACQANKGQAAALLLSSGAAVDAKCSKGYTPLHYASKGGHAEIVQLLLLGHAPVDAASTEGRTPLYLATKGRHEQVIQQLLSNGAQARLPDNSGWVALHAAAHLGHTECARLLLRADPTPGHVNALGGKEQTPLHIACAQGRSEVVPLLLEAGADVNAMDGEGDTPLHSATQGDHPAVVQQLLCAGAQLQSNNNGWLAVHVAAQLGYTELVSLLMADAAPAQVNALDFEGQTPLYLACASGRSGVVRLLLTQFGAGVNVMSRDGCSPLYIATERGHTAVVQLLSERGADALLPAEGGCLALHAAAELGDTEVVQLLLTADATLAHVNALDAKEQTPLFLACAEGHSAVVQLLLGYGALPLQPAEGGWLALHVAAERGHTEVVQLLLTADATPAHVDALDVNEQTPLHLACVKGRSEVVRVLVEAGTYVNAIDLEGFSPLYNATQGRHTAIVQLLLRSGAEPLLPVDGGWLALHTAAGRGHTDLVCSLLHANSSIAHVEAVTDTGLTPLLRACCNGHSEVVPLLLEAGADVYARDEQEYTPLHGAVQGGHLVVVRQLLAAGADPGAVAAGGLTGLCLAAMGGHMSVLEVLLTATAAEEGAVDAGYVGKTPLQWAVERGHTNCVKVLLAAGADADQLYGEEAEEEEEEEDGGSLAGACALHRAVQLQHTEPVLLLASTSNMRHLWLGQTPLHLALIAADSNAEQEEGAAAAVQMAQALLAAGAPVGLVNGEGRPAMLLAADSSNPGVRALLPAMWQRQCELYKQQQQQKEQPPHTVTADVVADVVGDMHALLESLAVGMGLADPTLGLACFRCTMEVLGEAATRDMLQGLLVKIQPAPGNTAAASSVSLLLTLVLHEGWFTAVLPLMQTRWQVINRLQMLVSQHLPPQPQQAQQPQQQLPHCVQCAHSRCPELRAAAVAAAVAGRWSVFVQLLDQLTGLCVACGGAVMTELEQRQLQGGEGAPNVAGLCGALLEAWVAARQQVASRVRRELAGAVVGAVEAAGQCPARGRL